MSCLHSVMGKNNISYASYATYVGSFTLEFVYE